MENPADDKLGIGGRKIERKIGKKILEETFFRL